MNWAGRRVLVTGHTGFKGTWLSLWLASLGAEVVGLAGPPPSVPSLFEAVGAASDVEDVRVDIRDPAAVLAAVERSRADVVFHLAAQPIVAASMQDPASTMATNVLGTVHLLDALRRAPDAPAIVVVTSDKCYARGTSAHRHREDDPLGGSDPYSASKAAQELAAAAFRASYGLRIATARAGNVIGGGDWGSERLLPDLVRAAARGATAHIRNPEHIRPWQHVLNPLSGYLLLAERLLGGAGAEAWNFGPSADDERPVSWIVERVRALWPGGLQVEMGSLAEGTETPVLRLDSSKARDELGWRPGWDLARGLEEAVWWYATHAAGGDGRALMLAQIAEFGAQGTRR